ncbi:ATP-binding protein [Sphingomonas profundi]|uniref:ATP-binding protein n=1 Tax=Alterirhizorhabdus profundi TaxID=2681549 RepID=UPI0012E8141B|nr:ATP-binding protein [Sphingomonas profundi]
MLVLHVMHGNDPAISRFAADGHAAATALAVARRFAEQAALPRDPRERLAIVVEELILNIVEHGAADGGAIDLMLAREGDEIRLVIEDAGIFFDPRDVEPPATLPQRGGGVGLALVRAWTRIDRYARANGRNRLELAIPLGGEASEKAGFTRFGSS